ncbi:MAG: O-antigen polymerase [Planctomycetota bacterium]|nr:O-antigen polymerase [Planctomycetota bacterium]
MHWIALILLGGIIGAILLQAARRRLDCLSVPVLAAGVFGFLYLWMPIWALVQGQLFNFMGESDAAWAVGFSCLALAALWFGWFVALCARRDHPASVARMVRVATQWDSKRLYNGGLVLVGLGFCLWLVFLGMSGGLSHYYSGVHGSHGVWTSTTAWIYNGLGYVYPGLCFMIVALVRGARRPKHGVVGVVIVAVLMFCHSVLTGGRGPFFTTAVTVGGAILLAARKRPKFHTVLTAGVVLGLCIGALVTFRSALHLGTNAEEFESIGYVGVLGYLDDVTNLSYDSVGHEFIYHTGTISTVDRLGRCGWGKRYVLYLLIHPIPRVLWPGKPYVFETGTVTSEDIASIMGWQVATGAAVGLVADWYREWGVFSLLAWFLLGAVFARLYDAAVQPNGSPFVVLLYVLVLSQSLYLFAQGFLPFVESLLIRGLGGYLVWRVYVSAAHRANRARHRLWMSGARAVQSKRTYMAEPATLLNAQGKATR